MRLALVGASGRMGRAIARLAHADGIEIVCAVGVTDVGRDVGELAGVGPIGTSVVDGIGALEHASADVVIDFSAPSVTLALAPIAAAGKCALVSGTTGLTEEARTALAEAAERVPVLWEPNMSLGVYALSQLVAEAVAALGDWDIEIVETHHRAKIDAPSGTALRLAEAALRGRAAGMRLVHGRQGKPGARPADEIGMHALRGGDVIGDHTVHLFGGGERIELTHRATSRDVFAHGALRAARWIVGKPPRAYSLGDVLGRRP
ncbi:MAG TPA: 4-hydroxy-tetrahydrodipicolinate reductase [Polyangiaceae bacterium]|jgi:4-hydroxy-tetrahydrodipicolinate reductase|nr:4-hydroxy-tetrahydrodipicolinate reductase [Polyangiaceae bacterium]